MIIPGPGLWYILLFIKAYVWEASFLTAFCTVQVAHSVIKAIKSRSPIWLYACTVKNLIFENINLRKTFTSFSGEYFSLLLAHFISNVFLVSHT